MAMATVIQMAKGDMERDNRQRITVVEQENKYLSKDFLEYKQEMKEVINNLMSEVISLRKATGELRDALQQVKGGYWTLLKVGSFITIMVGLVATLAAKWSAWVK